MSDKHEALLYQRFRSALSSTGWHWFAFHFQTWPPHPFAQSLLQACARLDRRMPGLGKQFLLDVARIGGKEKHHPDYDQLMQKLSEILILLRIVELGWPEGTSFTHEPEGTPGGKRPELLVVSPGQNFLFEVKAPSLLNHQLLRSQNGTQLPSRGIPLELAKTTAGEDGLTLPRDNPVKDFLIDADAKFASFKSKADYTSTLIILWDDFIYEPITALAHAQSGLLTANSFAKDANGNPLTFPNVDAVVLIRHLLYFQRFAGGALTPERAHAFDFGDEASLRTSSSRRGPGRSLPLSLTGFVRFPWTIRSCSALPSIALRTSFGGARRPAF
ncbi:hypothetical protein ABIB75_004230 [Bradyrhizobium sp. GM2.2]|uniref:hypothetical protein n=1 Tax=Bradyrhizobium sp. GM2.2 TaxID=3156358 RepID=UPI00339762CC